MVKHSVIIMSLVRTADDNVRVWRCYSTVDHLLFSEIYFIVSNNTVQRFENVFIGIKFTRSLFYDLIIVTKPYTVSGNKCALDVSGM